MAVKISPVKRSKIVNNDSASQECMEQVSGSIEGLRVLTGDSLYAAEAGEPVLTAVRKGHGRLERRQVWVSGELAGYTGFPGLSPVAMVRQDTEHLPEGRHIYSVQYGVSSLEQLDPEHVLGPLRGHWSIENQHFQVKAYSFSEDCQVLGRHHSGAVMSLLSNAALGLPLGECQLWRNKEPLTGHSQRLYAHPSIILPPNAQL